MKRDYLVNDFVIFEDVCNGQCEYCITGSSIFKENHKSLKDNQDMKFRNHKLLEYDNTYSEGARLKSNIDTIVASLKQNANAFILKISGGEILLIKNILDFIESIAKDYSRIQILTNGFVLDSKIVDRLSRIENLSLQISMDGHNLDLNRYRVKNQIVQTNLNNIIKECCIYKIPVEINCVLTDSNIYRICEFVDFLNDYNNVLFLPYPVRGQSREIFFPQKEQLVGLEKLMENYEKYNKILPPKAYLNAMNSFIKENKKHDSCFLPRVIYQSFDDGTISPCSNIWFKTLGNILEDPEKVYKKLKNDMFYEVIKKYIKKIEHCRNCFTPWEMVNLYLCNEIEEAEMRKIYIYNDDNIINFLNSLRKEITEERTK